MNGVNVNFVVDTGAERTVISKNVIDKINNDDQPNLSKGKKFGRRCKVNTVLDQISIYREVVNAEIRDAVLLGMDILKDKDGKPAENILSRSKIILNGQERSCQHFPQTFSCSL